MSELKIKKCPFCDSVAELDFSHRSFTYTDKNGELRDTGFHYTVKCTNEICGCRIGIYEEPKMAIEAWNRRIINDITPFPSAQPDIIHCKDCKFAEVADKEDNQDGYTCQFHRGSIWFSGSYCSWAERQEE